MVQTKNAAVLEFAGIITAFRTLTILPVPGKEARIFSHALPFFWVVGVVISFIPVSCMLLVKAGFDASIAAIFGVFLTTVITGGLHIDGLADSCDGFGGGRGNKERTLEIFKDSRLGSFGVIAVVFDLLFKVFAWQLLLKHGFSGSILIAGSIIFSRSIQPLLLVFLPNARGKGGLLNAFEHANNMIKIVVVLPVLFFSMGFKVLWPASFLPILVATLVSIVAAMLFSIYCMKKINGMTGDTVGATSEIVEMVFLLSAIASNY